MEDGLQEQNYMCMNEICHLGVPSSERVLLFARHLQRTANGTVGTVAVLPVCDYLPRRPTVGIGALTAIRAGAHVFQNVLHSAAVREVALHAVRFLLKMLVWELVTAPYKNYLRLGLVCRTR